MKKYKFIILLFVLAALFSGCRKDAPELKNPNETGEIRTPSQLFESFWHGMNNSYVFWDIDPTDWDQVYDEFLPRFQALNEEEEIATATLEGLFSEICKDLIDHHFSFMANNAWAPEGDTLRFAISPGNAEVRTRDYYHDQMTNEALRASLESNRAGGRISDFVYGFDEGGEEDQESIFAMSYRIDEVIYFYLSAFGLSFRYGDPENPVTKVIQNYHRMILESPEIKGVIIDVRNNGGGYINDMNLVFAPLLGEDQLFAYTRYKEGPGRLDYSPWVPCIIAPAEQHRKVEAPIVILADIWSISMAEMTTIAVSSLPNGCFIGERTFGGQGVLGGNYNITYGGRFQNDLLDAYLSTYMLKDRDGIIHEGKGITPDIEVLYDENAMLNGTDAALEKALEYIQITRKL